MALDRLFDLTPDGKQESIETVWGAVVAGGALSTIGAPLQIGGQEYQPSSSQTIRVRYRSDLTTDALLRDAEGRIWRVAEWLEVGRRQWLDLACSTYQLAELPPGVDCPETRHGSRRAAGICNGGRVRATGTFSTRRATCGNWWSARWS